MDKPIYKRLLLKLGGESLASGEGAFGLDQGALSNFSEEILEARKLDVEIAIVIGGGNILRGASLSSIGIERTTG
ncbi:MAG: UMP kinase, partial [Nitrospinaceae bacterium]